LKGDLVIFVLCFFNFEKGYFGYRFIVLNFSLYDSIVMFLIVGIVFECEFLIGVSEYFFPVYFKEIFIMNRLEFYYP
jgi:hypothetical protein